MGNTNGTEDTIKIESSNESESNNKRSSEKKSSQENKSDLRKQHKDTLFRDLFKIPEHFMFLLKKCSGGKIQVTKDELQPFDLSTTYTKRPRWNYVSFLTKDDKLIIFVEHQTTLSPNFAFKLLLYYLELMQLWLKTKNISIHGATVIPEFPDAMLYVAYNGKDKTEKLEQTSTAFNMDSTNIKINITVEIVDIRYDNLEELERDNILAGYSYFYSRYDFYHIKKKATTGEAFIKAREDCIKAGYLKDIIDKEAFVLMYKDFMDYDAQLRVEGKEEKAAETAFEMLQRGFSLEDISAIIKMPIMWVEEILKGKQD